MKNLFIGVAAAFLATSAHAVPIQWSSAAGGNDHWYEFVTTPATWGEANTGASTRSHNGLAGHLLTLTSQAEKDFVNGALLNGANTWLGAMRLTGQNAFAWVAGPETGTVFFDGGVLPGQYSSFWAGEPNGLAGGENFVEMWGNNWNDLSATHQRAYVVEYSAVIAPAPVPLPASGLMLVGGLAALVMGRRRKPT